MNEDLLECKRKAQELITSSRAPDNGNGRKKGYIEVMKNLWDAKGYGGQVDKWTSGQHLK